MIKQYRSKVFKSDQTYWEGNWTNIDISYLCTDGVIKYEELPILLKFIKKEHKIIDIGCGLGQFVYYLNKLGYNIKGVDFSEELIARARAFEPGMPLHVGDAECLKYQDKSFDVAFSFGVVEHFEHGPDRALDETNRILTDRGLLFIDVPYFNITRKLLWPFLKLTEYYHRFKHKQFNQYYFSDREIKKYLRKAGFRIIYVQRMYPYTMFLNNRILNLVRRTAINLIGNKQVNNIKKHIDSYNQSNICKDNDNIKKRIRIIIKKALCYLTPHFIFLVCIKDN